MHSIGKHIIHSEKKNIKRFTNEMKNIRDLRSKTEKTENEELE